MLHVPVKRLNPAGDVLGTALLQVTVPPHGMVAYLHFEYDTEGHRKLSFEVEAADWLRLTQAEPEKEDNATAALRCPLCRAPWLLQQVAPVTGTSVMWRCQRCKTQHDGRCILTPAGVLVEPLYQRSVPANARPGGNWMICS
jgi:hypothetical protein